MKNLVCDNHITSILQFDVPTLTFIRRFISHSAIENKTLSSVKLAEYTCFDSDSKRLYYIY